MFSSQNSQVSSDANYIEDVFQTFLYTGNGSTQTITNGIDLSGKGGLVWLKARNAGQSNNVYDTLRGATNQLYTDGTYAQASSSTSLTAFNSNGFTVGGSNLTGASGNTYVGWTFRKQAKFFDVVTYTGNSTAGRTISHNLGSVPGCIIVKATNGTSSWFVYHQSLGNTSALFLQATNAAATSSAYWNNTSPTSTEFTLGGGSTNTDTVTYVAYLFAHNAGGFGLTGTDNVISCGSYTGSSSSDTVVNLGYEPQFVMIKKTNGSDNWLMFDSMRGLTVKGQKDAYLWANSSNYENQFWGASDYLYPTATGFALEAGYGEVNADGFNYIYIAIRRGPMKVPTSGTSVFKPTKTSAADGTAITVGFPTDSQWANYLAGDGNNTTVFDRLRGMSSTSGSTSQNRTLFTSTTGAESSSFGVGYFTGVNNTGWVQGSYASGVDTVRYDFRRAPSFFDEVCYTGDDAAPRTLSHNLGVAPELLITKRRSSGGTTGSNRWYVTAFNLPKSGSNYQSGILNGTDAFDVYTQIQTAPTSTTFTLGVDAFYANISPQTYVAYLFATCAGVSKVGSYTGTGTTKQINCGFTGGARFVLIKRTDSTGDWYVWDTARGIVSGNDPYLLLNNTDAETTGTDYIDTYSAGFEISSTAPAAINASGGTFIFLAIA